MNSFLPNVILTWCKIAKNQTWSSSERNIRLYSDKNVCIHAVLSSATIHNLNGDPDEIMWVCKGHVEDGLQKSLGIIGIEVFSRERHLDVA